MQYQVSQSFYAYMFNSVGVYMLMVVNAGCKISGDGGERTVTRKDGGKVGMIDMKWLQYDRLKRTV